MSVFVWPTALWFVSGVAMMYVRFPILDPEARFPLLPRFDPAARPNPIDFYYWYYGTYAMFQVGSDKWKRWNDAMQKALLPNQRTGGCDLPRGLQLDRHVDDADPSLQAAREPCTGGDRFGAHLLHSMMNNIEAYLACCQLGITMASLGLGWVGEPTVSALLEPVLPLWLYPRMSRLARCRCATR